MSVNNVNSLYQTQGIQGSTSYTTLSQDDGGGVDIGKLLLGGLGTVVTIGLGVAAYKSGKQSSLTKESDNVFTTMCNGVKNWLGKNGDDVAGTLDNIPQEYRTSLKTLFSGGTLNQTELDDLYNNRKVLSDFITNTKVSNNTRKMDIVEELRKHLGNDTKLEASDDTAKLLNQLLSKDGTEIFRFENNAITLIDDANEVLVAKARKLEILSNDNKFNNRIDLDSLHSKYSAKHNNYQSMANGLNNSNTSEEFKTKLNNDMGTSKFNPLFSRYSDMADKKTLEAIKTADDFVLYTAKLKKYQKAGSLTNDEYLNLMAQAENNFAKNENEYIKYMTKGLTDADGNPITINSTTKLTEKDINALHKKYPTLNLEKDHTLTAKNLLTYSQNQHNDIASFLGIRGKTLSDKSSGFKFSGDKLIWRSSKSSKLAPKQIFEKDIGKNCTTTQEDAQTTQIQINLKQLQKIFSTTTTT